MGQSSVLEKDMRKGEAAEFSFREDTHIPGTELARTARGRRGRAGRGDAPGASVEPLCLKAAGHDSAGAGSPADAEQATLASEEERDEHPSDAVAEGNAGASGEAGKAPSKSRSRGKKRGERNAELGRRGEDAAASFLYRLGYDIVERNWTCIAGEADIIARDGSWLVFVEVKTRSSCEKGFPSEAVNRSKRDRYERIAALYIRDCDVADAPVRFDIVSLVLLGSDRALVRHHINAFGVD